MVRTGEVLAYDPKLGWGHIRPDDLSANVFAHHTTLRCARGFRKLVVGQRVEYEARERPDGKPEAVLVTGPHGAFLDDPVLPCAPSDAPGALPKARKLMIPRVVACPRALPAARAAAPSVSACPPASARRQASREAGIEPRTTGAALGDGREGGEGERAARRAKARGKKRGGQRGVEERPPAPAACAEPVEPQVEGEPSKKRRKKRAAKG